MAEVNNAYPQIRAEAALSSLIEENPGCTVNKDEHKWIVGTGFVTFGTFEGQPVVFKYCDWQPHKERQEEALRLFASTGLVPKLYPVDSNSILVMERLRGSTLYVVEQRLEPYQMRRVYHQLGQAVPAYHPRRAGDQLPGHRGGRRGRR